MPEHVAIWVWMLTDVIDPAGGISAEDLGWAIATVLGVLALIAAWDKRADKRTMDHVRTETQPIKAELKALRVNQAQWMRKDGVEPAMPPPSDDD